MIWGKTCKRCKKIKSVREFSLKKGYKDGLRPNCKVCRNKMSHIHRQQNLEKSRATTRQYYSTLRGYLCSRFQNIKHRCDNPNNKGYHNYGGRGIKNKFKSSQEFIDYVINELQIDPRGLDIDRINNNGHYEPGNIRFVTHSENCKNKKR